ncbi:hypothetical protein [Chryseobacterium pennipullorum]|nr:hypothetical protein [Chryseobacterium pennipullorum]
MDTTDEQNLPDTGEPTSSSDTDQQNVAPLSDILSREDEIIQYIKDKATKETLKSLAPLLEKLEEAVKQQQQENLPQNPAIPVINYDEQLKNLQEISQEKMKAKEMKVAERLGKLQAKLANIRK